MTAGYTVRTAWNCDADDKVIVVANFTYMNEVVHYSFPDYKKEINKYYGDVGIWRIKTLKK